MPKKGFVDSVIAHTKIVLRKMKIQFPDKLIMAHLNINSIRNKFDSLFFTTENHTDILLSSETKLDDSFPLGKFETCKFSMPHRYGRDSVVDFYVILEDDDFGTNTENSSVVINLRTKKWF